MQKETTVEQLKQESHLTMSKFAHEIRNPLALITSELQLMSSSHPEITQYETWDDILDNLEYIKELLNDLSSYNNADRVSPTMENPGKFLNTVLSGEKVTLDYLGIALETDIPTDLPPVPLDHVKMRQALLNLLRNAQEAITHSQGRIFVSLKPTEQGICISIKDNGCGISPEQLENIFTPFVTYKSQGTGLGLAVTRQIIEAHHGHMEISSKPGQGSEFRIFLG